MSKKIVLNQKSNTEEEELDNKEEIEVEEAEAEEIEAEEAEGEEVEEVEVQIKENKEDKKEKKLKASKGGSLKRRKSLYEGFDENQALFRPEYKFSDNDPVKDKMWELMDTYLPRDKLNIQKSIVKHIEYTLSKTRFDVNSQYFFQGTALSVRDRLLEQWNDTQLFN